MSNEEIESEKTRTFQMAAEGLNALVAMWIAKTKDGTITASEQKEFMTWIKDAGVKPIPTKGSQTESLMNQIPFPVQNQDEDEEDQPPFINQKSI